MNVTAIMPVRGRQRLAQLAIECFLAQDYPDKELRVIQDADDPSFHAGFIPPERVRIDTLPTRRPISTKLNRMCQESAAAIIVRWDSDDWSAPGRISAQMKALEESGKAVTGYRSMLFWDGSAPYLWRCNAADYSLGTSLCFRRSWWATHPFPETGLGKHSKTGAWYGEDGVFSRKAHSQDQLLNLECGALMVARIHPGNSYPKDVDCEQYRKKPLEVLPKEFPR
jgi:glycosyltransferase involved in cell wall biosynthesis